MMKVSESSRIQVNTDRYRIIPFRLFCFLLFFNSSTLLFMLVMRVVFLEMMVIIEICVAFFFHLKKSVKRKIVEVVIVN